MTLPNVIIQFKPVLNKDKNHYYYKIFRKIVGFGKTEIAKERFYAARKPIKIWNVNVDKKVISKLVKIKTNSKYLIGYLDNDIRPLVSIMPKMSGYVKAFKVEDKTNKLMSFRIDEKLLEEYKAIWTKIKDLINIRKTKNQKPDTEKLK